MRKFLLPLFVTIFFLGCSSDDESSSCGVYEGSIGLYYQEDVDDFAKCNYTSIEGNLYISDDAPIGNMGSVIKDLKGLSSLTSISGNIEIRDLKGLTTLDGLDNIESCMNLTIASCEKLTNIDGLGKLKPKGGIYISTNFKLERLSGFHFDDNSTVATIIVSNCPLIKNIDVFKGVIKSLVVVQISSNYSLKDIEGLRDIQVIGGDKLTTSSPALEIRYNESLESLAPFSNLTTVDYGGMDISNNPLILNLDGFSSVTDFKGDIHIIDNDNLLNIDGLSNITEVEKLRISDNDNLQNINGLSNMSLVRRKLHIRRNTSLTDFCGIENLVLNGLICCGYDGYLAEGNAYNPTQQDIIDGNCSQ